MKRKILHHCFPACARVLTGVCLFIFSMALVVRLNAQTVWNSGSLTFTKADFANADLESNQDRITANTWLTRRNIQGIFNIHNETVFVRKTGTTPSSPSNTEWSYGTISNYATLTYTDWETWFAQNPLKMINTDAVVHLISENIYIGIKFLSWTESGGGGGFSYTRTTPSALPVKLVSFSAKIKDKKVVLDWATAAEQNSASFQLERSTDGIHYSAVNIITSSGNTTAVQNYGYTDTSPVQGMNYYRLKQIDRNGQFTYSNIVALNFTDKKNSIIINRSAGIVYITSNEGNDDPMLVQLFTGNGILLKKESYLSKSAQLSIKEVPQGIYIIKVITGNSSYSEKIFKP